MTTTSVPVVEPEHWVCVCPVPVLDVLGECSECHRKPESELRKA